MIVELLRRYEFPGKRRLRRHLRVPDHGEAQAVFPEGFRLTLDLSEPLQRDFYAGVYDKHELELVRRLLRQGGDAVDIGAHIGLYTVVASRQARRVLAFEPNEGARAHLERNLRLNGCENVTVDPRAVSDEAGTASLWVDGDSAWSTLREGWLAGSHAVEVETTTLDAEVERLGLEPAVLKIDVEGNELEVLRGAARTLERHRPAVLCEVGPGTAAAVEQLLGYEAFRIHPRRLERNIGRAEGLFNALFCTPEQARVISAK